MDMCMSLHISIVIFFLCKHLINSIEKADAIFFKKVQRNGNYPLISSYESKFVNVFCLEDSQNHKISIPLIQDHWSKSKKSDIWKIS
ncbi:unnamed protein product [Rhizophagus irregularis]|nr:unnamed protein product [Rhizophagus irregularis]